MFLRQKPRLEERRILAASLLAILLAGCSGMRLDGAPNELDPGNDATTDAGLATSDPSIELSLPLAIGTATSPVATEAATPAFVIDGLDVEHQVELEKLAQQRELDEARVWPQSRPRSSKCVNAAMPGIASGSACR